MPLVLLGATCAPSVAVSVTNLSRIHALLLTTRISLTTPAESLGRFGSPRRLVRERLAFELDHRRILIANPDVAQPDRIVKLSKARDLLRSHSVSCLPKTPHGGAD